MGWLFNRRVLGAVAAVVAVVMIISLTARERRHLTVVEEWFHDALAPLAAGLHAIAATTRDTVAAVGEFGRLREENERLQGQLAELEDVERQFKEMMAAYLRMQGLLGLKERLPVETAAAHVIGRNPDNWFGTVILDVGRDHGIRPDMVVVNQRGVVGRVVRFTGRTSTVMLLTDPESGVGAVVARTGYAGIVLGSHRQSGKLLMRFFSHDVEVREGDRIVTSGLGGMFPKGLDIGVVETVERDHVNLQVLATVRPAVDFDRLEEVLVLHRPDAPPPEEIGGEPDAQTGQGDDSGGEDR